MSSQSYKNSKQNQTQSYRNKEKATRRNRQKDELMKLTLLKTNQIRNATQ